MLIILILHVFSCWFMTGAIWLVQILVYPNFRLIGEREFLPFHTFHVERITWVVGPLMFLELATGFWLAFSNPTPFYLFNFALAFLLWVLTATINVPSHNVLSYDSDLSKISLIRKNWPRTLIWSTRSLLLVWILYLNLEGVVK